MSTLFSHASQLRQGRKLKKNNDKKKNSKLKNKPNGMFAAITKDAPSSSPSQAPMPSEEAVNGLIEGDYGIPAPDYMPPYEGGDFGVTPGPEHILVVDGYNAVLAPPVYYLPPKNISSSEEFIIVHEDEWVPCGGDAFIRNNFVLREWPECVGMTVFKCEQLIVQSIHTANDVPVTFVEVAEGSINFSNLDECRVRVFFQESKDGNDRIVVNPHPSRG